MGFVTEKNFIDLPGGGRGTWREESREEEEEEEEEEALRVKKVFRIVTN